MRKEETNGDGLVVTGVKIKSVISFGFDLSLVKIAVNE